MTFPSSDDLRLRSQPIDPRRLAGQGRRREPRVGGLFLRGPVALDWLAQAARLRGRALAVGVLLWFMVGLTKSRSVHVPGCRLADFGLDRFALYRGLAALERAKLVTLRRRRGAHPRVTVVD
jgi:hypothetical protein